MLRSGALVSIPLVSLILAVGGQATAETLEAVRPGLMCRSADALAKLTMPDGSSSLAQGSLTKPFEQVRRERQAYVDGGCRDIPDRVRVTTQAIRKLTSIVTYDDRDGNGPQTYIVPNIDFKPATGADGCSDQDTPVTMRGTLQEIFSHDRHTGSQYSYFRLHTVGAHCLKPGFDTDQSSSTPTHDVTLLFNDEQQASMRQLVGHSVTMSGRISGSNGGGPQLEYPQLQR